MVTNSVFQGSFTSDSLTVVAHDQSVYTAEPGKIQVRNFQVSENDQDYQTVN